MIPGDVTSSARKQVMTMGVFSSWETMRCNVNYSPANEYSNDGEKEHATNRKRIYQREKLGTLGRVPKIYTHIYHLYMGNLHFPFESTSILS